MKKLNNKNIASLLNIFYLSVSILFMGSCGVDADQRNFEQKALTAPQGITEMTAQGVHAKNSEPDPSDWKISPEYYGLIEVQTTAYPNPVSFNGTLKIILSISGIETVNGIFIYVYRSQIDQLIGPFYSERQPTQGFLTISLDPGLFAQTGAGASNLYRIVIYDGSNNIITYGDVKVKQ